MHGRDVLALFVFLLASISVSAQVLITQPSGLDCASLVGNGTCPECVSRCGSTLILCAATCARRPGQCNVPFNPKRGKEMPWADLVFRHVYKDFLPGADVRLVSPNVSQVRNPRLWRALTPRIIPSSRTQLYQQISPLRNPMVPQMW